MDDAPWVNTCVIVNEPLDVPNHATRFYLSRYEIVFFLFQLQHVCFWDNVSNAEGRLNSPSPWTLFLRTFSEVRRLSRRPGLFILQRHFLQDFWLRQWQFVPDGDISNPQKMMIDDLCSPQDDNQSTIRSSGESVQHFVTEPYQSVKTFPAASAVLSP